MSNSEIYQQKLKDLDVISYDKFEDKELAQRVYYMFMALQEQIDELREANGDEAENSPTTVCGVGRRSMLLFESQQGRRSAAPSAYPAEQPDVQLGWRAFTRSVGKRGPFLRLPSHAPLDGLLHPLGNVSAHVFELGRLGGDVPRHHRLRGRPGERRLPGEHRVDETRQRIDVGVGSPMSICPAACSGLMYSGVPTINPLDDNRSPPALTMALAMPKSQINAFGVFEYHVFRFDVPMDDLV